MSNTYCGRDCATCTKKEAMGCPGCRVGPGRSIDGDCELAKCCRNKGHASCATCVSNTRCGMYRNRANAAEERLKRRRAQEDRVRDLAVDARQMTHWFRLLFWLFLPGLIGSVFTTDAIAEMVPIMYIPGLILQHGSNIAYCVILFMMANHEERYSKAGIFMLISVVLSLIQALAGATNPALALLFALPGAVVSVLSVYNEYTAHSNFFEEVDFETHQNWSLLWKVYLVTLCMTVGGLFLAIISPVLAVIVIIIGAIGAVIAGIMKQVLLWRSAKNADYFAMAVEED